MPHRQTDSADAAGDDRSDLLSALDGPFVDAVRLRRDELAYLGDASRSGEPVGLAVVEMVATVTERPATSLPPLYDAVDPAALDALCAPERPAGRDVRVSFSYEGFAVTVHRSGRVELVPD